jgi:hypothetical protein
LRHALFDVDHHDFLNNVFSGNALGGGGADVACTDDGNFHNDLVAMVRRVARRVGRAGDAEGGPLHEGERKAQPPSRAACGSARPGITTIAASVPMHGAADGHPIRLPKNPFPGWRATKNRQKERKDRELRPRDAVDRRWTVNAR